MKISQRLFELLRGHEIMMDGRTDRQMDGQTDRQGDYYTAPSDGTLMSTFFKSGKIREQKERDSQCTTIR